MPKSTEKANRCGLTDRQTDPKHSRAFAFTFANLFLLDTKLQRKEN